ncbi:sensor histidine kinase [Paenibacillus rhizophilus]|uniref:sensor histidine kinase n=1 Tax=Paenibacillus rhizophilus TaxID=1850366 RepID=UPI00163B0A55|nr:HAMP domain-containing sensor histidine kinase [Paenibacillus rhizophilus]
MLVLINPLLINNNIELTVDLPEELAVCVQKTPIQQVLSNLLNNSIDALGNVSREKRIWISSDEDEQWIYLKIANNGPKIPDDIQRKLFQPFVTGREHGTGLGLTICKKIMENHKGNMFFRSTDNETVFILGFKKP